MSAVSISVTVLPLGWWLWLRRGSRSPATRRLAALRPADSPGKAAHRAGSTLSRFWAARPAKHYDRDLADALAAVARSLRAGGSLTAAIIEGATAVPGPVGADLAEVHRRVELGSSWPESLAGWHVRRPQRSVAVAAGGLAVGLQTGTASARVLDGLVEAIRIDVDGHAEARALAAQARASVVVLVASPLVFLTVSSALGGSSVRFLFGTPLGVLCLIGGVLLDVGAACWMRAIVGSAS